MLGKAVYEGILVDLPLAGFFLAKLRDGRPPELNDLATLDPELYHHLYRSSAYRPTRWRTCSCTSRRRTPRPAATESSRPADPTSGSPRRTGRDTCT